MRHVFAQAVPLTGAIGTIAFLWSRGALKSWLARIGWALALFSMATLVMYWLEAGTLRPTGAIFTQHMPGIVGLFQIGLNFVILYFVVAGPWMVLGCALAGIVAGVGTNFISKSI